MDTGVYFDLCFLLSMSYVPCLITWGGVDECLRCQVGRELERLDGVELVANIRARRGMDCFDAYDIFDASHQNERAERVLVHGRGF